MRTLAIAGLIAAALSLPAVAAERAETPRQPAGMHAVHAKPAPAVGRRANRQDRALDAFAQAPSERRNCDWLGCPGMILLGVGF